MKKKIVVISILVVLLLSAVFRVTAVDPIVPLSYFTETFIPEAKQAISDVINSKLNAFRIKYGLNLENLEEEEEIYYAYAPELTAANLATGGTLELAELSTFYLISGYANVHIDGELIDLSSGNALTSDAILETNHRYLAAESSGAVVRAYSDSVHTFIQGNYRLTYSDEIPAELTFIDMPISHWANTYVTYAYEQGIVNGVGEYRFSPSGTVTRAMFVTMLGRLSGVNQVNYYREAFDDVDPASWYGTYVAWASELGIVTGYEDGTFRPDGNISREQMAAILYRFSAYTDSIGIAGSIYESAATSFTDADSVSEWAEGGVNWAADYGLITGYTDGSFGPQKSAARAEVCTILYRLQKMRGVIGDDTIGDDTVTYDSEPVV